MSIYLKYQSLKISLGNCGISLADMVFLGVGCRLACIVSKNRGYPWEAISMLQIPGIPFGNEGGVVKNVQCLLGRS